MSIPSLSLESIELIGTETYPDLPSQLEARLQRFDWSPEMRCLSLAKLGDPPLPGLLKPGTLTIILIASAKAGEASTDTLITWLKAQDMDR